MSRPVVLIMHRIYLPGFKAGGPIRSIANLVNALGDEFDFRIITGDRDAGDTGSFSTVQVDAWNQVGKAQVFYASRKSLSFRGLRRLVSSTPHQVLYLNSFFSFRFTIMPLLTRWLGLLPRTPCVLAPRGEFSQGAIGLKAWKKRPFMLLVKAMKLYSGIHWQATSETEKADIVRELRAIASDISIAANVSSTWEVHIAGSASAESVFPERLRMIFLSRISPKKNLDFLLRLLQNLNVEASLDIYGPISEVFYWRECQELIAHLPQHVRAEYRGTVEPADVKAIFSKYDVFVFPTRGENFGHVILESLSAGTPVMVSDQTPWKASSDGAVEVLSLRDPGIWRQAIERWANLGLESLKSRSEAAKSCSRSYLQADRAVEQNRQLLINAISGIPL